MHEETLTPEGLRLADYFSSCSFISQFHLVGGTALSLQLGHRKSDDLDFFTLQDFDPQDWSKEVNAIPLPYKLNYANNLLDIDAGPTNVTFLYFGYPPLTPLLGWRGLNVMSAEDIGLFKLLAVIGRNRKKDIVDLYFIDKEVMPLREIVQLFSEKYHKSEVNMLRQIEELFNDEAIERSDMPIVLKEFDWQEGYAEVKSRLTQAIRELIV